MGGLYFRPWISCFMVCDVVSSFIFQCVFSMSIYVNPFESGTFDLLFLLSKRNESLLMFSPFLLLNRSGIGRLLWCGRISEIFRNLYDIPKRLVTLVFQESLGIPHLNPFFAPTIHKMPSETIGWFDQKTYFRKEVLSEMLRWFQTFDGVKYLPALNFCSVPKQLGKSS